MTYQEIGQQDSAEYAALKVASPEVLGAFSQLHSANVQDGALSVQTKEFIALGIAIATHCEGCIVSHTKKLVSLQVTREEIVETINTAVMMNGGPATVYGGKALACFDELSQA
jgi:4-carboxymuconolactone decarboxylase